MTLCQRRDLQRRACPQQPSPSTRSASECANAASATACSATERLNRQRPVRRQSARQRVAELGSFGTSAAARFAVRLMPFSIIGMLVCRGLVIIAPAHMAGARVRIDFRRGNPSAILRPQQSAQDLGIAFAVDSDDRTGHCLDLGCPGSQAELDGPPARLDVLLLEPDSLGLVGPALVASPQSAPCFANS